MKIKRVKRWMTKSYDTEITLSKNHKLCVNKEGFTLWDVKDGRWIIDASCIITDNRIRVGTHIDKEAINTYTHARIFKGTYGEGNKK